MSTYYCLCDTSRGQAYTPRGILMLLIDILDTQNQIFLAIFFGASGATRPTRTCYRGVGVPQSTIAAGYLAYSSLVAHEPVDQLPAMDASLDGCHAKCVAHVHACLARFVVDECCVFHLLPLSLVDGYII